MENPKYLKLLLKSLAGIYCLLLLAGCAEEESGVEDPIIKNSVTYMLDEKSDSGLNGYVVFNETEDNTIMAKVFVAGTASGSTHPVHIHFNSAAEGGDIAITLEPVEGGIGESRTVFSKTDEGTAISYEELMDFNGYVNVHKGTNDITTVAQGDIGGNALAGASKQYALHTKGESGIKGNVTFAQRKNGSTKVTIALDTTITDAEFPAHIHFNSAAAGGSIAISLNAVDGSTGTSVTTVRKMDEDHGGEAISYDGLLNFNGYINIHQSSSDLATVVAQTDIGINELTGTSVIYPLNSVADNAIKGEATFAQRKNGQTLVTIALEGTKEGGAHPAHIHANSATEGGDIMISLNDIDGASGKSVTHVAALGDGTPISYEKLVEYNGYLNVHQSTADMETLVAQGDVGDNALTGESVEYPLAESDLTGKAIFYQRKNGLTLVEIMLEGTAEGTSHPAHIHANSAAEGGDIVISLNPVMGSTGNSKTTIGHFNNGGTVTYEQLVDYDGYLKVHKSEGDMGTVIAQGDVGSNALTGNEVIYTLSALSDSGISGTAAVAERKSGAALVTIQLEGTTALSSHPVHIHFNTAEKGGEIAISLNQVNGASGISKTHVEQQDNNLKVTYADLIKFEGHINVQKNNLGHTVVAQGNIGANVE